MFYTYVASISSRCCICLHWLHTCFRCMLQVFQVFRTYVANVSPRCCKSRPDVAHIVVDLSIADACCKLPVPPACAWVWRGREKQARKTMRAQIKTERRGKQSGMGHRAGTGQTQSSMGLT
jgi:hypothetical protein